MSSSHEFHKTSQTAPHFFKFLHDGNIQQGNLTIPERFVREHGNDISDPVLLNVPSGAKWRVRLSKCRAGVWSLDGLEEFIEFYSLRLGHFLLFRYEGRSSFCVVICDASASEIEYPVQEPSRVSESCSHDGFVESGALQMAASFESENPLFLVAMQASYVCSRFRLNIPTSFSAKYFLKDHDYINLLVSDDGPWRVKYTRYNSRRKTDSRVEFNVGWKVFAQDNNLVTGDVCVFELIDSIEKSIQVSIFRSRTKTGVPKIECTSSSDDFSRGETSLTRLRPQKMSNERSVTRPDVAKLEKRKRKTGLSSQQEEEGRKKQRTYGVLGKTTTLSSREMATALQMAKSLVKQESSFCTIFMQPSYVLNRMRLHIPNAFFHEHFPNNDRTNVILRDPNGKTWSVEYNRRPLQNRTPASTFTHGWKEFVQEHELEVGDACVFELIDSVEFSLKVTILRVNQYADDNHSERNNLRKIEESEDDVPTKGSVRENASSIGERISEYPFFHITMPPGYTHSRLSVPKSFATKHITKRSCSVQLQVADRSWIVELRVYKDGTCKFRDFSAFAGDNSLREGDVCVFRLIERNAMVFKVSIIRPDEKKSLHGQTHWLGKYILSLT